MLEILVRSIEIFDEATSEFRTLGEDITIQLEHSLASISKWEQIWEKPFLEEKTNRTTEETIGYIKAMCLTPNVPSEVFDRLSPENQNDISNYINRKMTATWFVDRPQVSGSRNKEIITSEIIYYWLVALQIPLEAEHWHLNKLLTLVKVTNEKNDPKKSNAPKTGRATLANQRRMLNEQRKLEHNTTG